MAWLAYKNDLRVRYFERVSVNLKKKKKKKGGFKNINKGAKLLKKLWCCVGGRV